MQRYNFFHFCHTDILNEKILNFRFPININFLDIWIIERFYALKGEASFKGGSVPSISVRGHCARKIG